MVNKFKFPQKQFSGRGNIADTDAYNGYGISPEKLSVSNDVVGLLKEIPLTIEELKRFGLYLSFLRLMHLRGRTDISLDSMADELSIDRGQIEEDIRDSGLGLAGQFAYNIRALTTAIEEILGYRNETEAFLIGTGKLGTSLLLKENLGQTNLKIVAAFDTDFKKIGSLIGSIRVMSPEKIIPLAERLHVCLGIISTPAGEAQHVADILTGAGMKAIWNFTPDEIETEAGIIVENTRLGQDLNAGYNNLLQRLRK